MDLVFHMLPAHNVDKKNKEEPKPASRLINNPRSSSSIYKDKEEGLLNNVNETELINGLPSSLWGALANNQKPVGVSRKSKRNNMEEH
ncbi:hypothetical protein Ancab_016965 [Ancistrocladus abbreviatus]